ncbi:spore germination protein, partial [Bacillus sp. B-TM1]
MPMTPNKEAIIIIGNRRRRIPFPPILEALLMELVLEMLREAAVR